jgi:hypothetical protein
MVWKCEKNVVTLGSGGRVIELKGREHKLLIVNPLAFRGFRRSYKGYYVKSLSYW